MANKNGACLVCGKELIYFDNPKQMKCIFCNEKFETYASCEDGHYVCDSCHSKKGIDIISNICLQSKSTNPIEIMQEIMDSPFIYMHGPEHHIMVGSALLTAYKNAGGEVDLAETLAEMKSRGAKYPGGSCGYWGCCGAAVSVGMFFSIISKTTPLSEETWGIGNKITSKCLQDIGDLGGPRCCKRNSFTAIKSAEKFMRNEFNINMTIPEKITCTHYKRNKQCIGKKCPYNPNTKAE